MSRDKISLKNHIYLIHNPGYLQLYCSACLQQLMSQTQVKQGGKIKSANIKYRKYDFKKRFKLIRMVETQNKSLASSAKQLGIAQTTARLIMRTWQQENRVFEKKTDRIKREKKEAMKQAQIKKKERQREKKLARKQLSSTQAVQQPQNEIKIEEDQQLIVEEEILTILPQITFELTACYNQLPYQAPYYLVHSQPYYF